MENTQFPGTVGGEALRKEPNMLIDIVMDGEPAESLRAVGQRLDLARRALGYVTRSDFADALGVSRQSLNAYLHGHYDIPYVIREKLWKMGVHPGWLYHGEEDGLTVSFVQRIRAAQLLMGVHSPRKGRGRL